MSEAQPGGPSSQPQPDIVDAAETPPDPPRETDPAAAGGEEHHFYAEDRNWIARLAGKGAAGTGAYGLGLIEAVHFYAADAPEKPLREALLARNRFGGLYDSELAELLRRAVPIVIPEER